jgi:phosphonate ABC transporter permease subunit PhnE
LGAAILAGLVIYAYGFEVTQVDLEDARSERRQQSLARIIRALARPALFEYDQIETVIQAPIFVPCIDANEAPPAPVSGATITVPGCADPGAVVQVEGEGFAPNVSGPLRFVVPSGVTLPLGTFETDGEGKFQLEVSLPERQSAEPQWIRATTRQNVGLPRWSRTAHDTWDKIIETIFLALLATTVGTAISIPVSFVAARNLMKDVKSPLVGVSLAVLAIPVGVALGLLVASWAANLSQWVSPNVAAHVGSIVILPMAMAVAARWALPEEEQAPPGLLLRLSRMVVLLLLSFGGLILLNLVATLMEELTPILAARLGPLGFLASFAGNLGEILGLLVPLIAAVGLASVLAGSASRLGAWVMQLLPLNAGKALGVGLAAIAGAVILLGVGLGLEWLYGIPDARVTRVGPALTGATIGLILAIRSWRRDELPVGMWVYFGTRTVLNTLRSIEPLIMVIVFAVWVGIGPFAGTLALALHTVAALAKLYSEQVESVMPGPLEAITATGATRLQTIVYAVVPQIIPPYISFTMYRWDINVRMSTIIGFAGGGGIGFLLQQNINLLNYREASAQMLAITLVVASMDYLSSTLRERVV